MRVPVAFRLGQVALGLLASAPLTAARADDLSVENQLEFEAAIATATQPGRSDTINVNAARISSGLGLVLPGAANSLIINFIGDSAGPSVYNPTFDVGVGSDGDLAIGPNTTINFSTDNGIAGFRVGVADAGVDGVGLVEMTGGTVQSLATGSDYLAVNVGRGSEGSHGTFIQSGGLLSIRGGSFNLGVEGATGTYTMTNDAAVNFTSGATLTLGHEGGTGTLNIHDDAQFIIDTSGGGTFGDVYIGDQGGTGVINQDGAGSRVVFGTHTRLGGGRAAGSVGGTGTYNLSAGQLDIEDLFDIGLRPDSVGTFNQTGGIVLLSGNMIFGAGEGTYNLDGGTLQVDTANPFSAGAGTYQFNLGGGTIQALTDFATSINFNLSGGTSVIDTFDGASGHSVTFSGMLSGEGALQKTGEGTLVLNAANTYTGGTWISGGTLQLGSSGSLDASGVLQVDAGATFDTNDHIQEVAALSGVGTIITGPSGRLDAGFNNEDTAFSGTIDGSFVKFGTGTMFIDGATFDGSAFIAFGTLAQTSGTTSITYMGVGEQPGSDGTLAVSGGTLNFGSVLQVGDFGGVGTVNQTAGTVRLAQTCGTPASCPALNIGNQGGTGTYNISGGTLELNGGLHNIGRSDGSNPASHGTLNISGDGLVVLQPDTGFSNGTLVIGSRVSTSDAGGQGDGVIHQTGGTLRVANDSTLFLSGYGDGTYDLLGGILQIGGNSLRTHYAGSGSYSFNFGGGTIEIFGTALASDVDAVLLADTVSTIDTNGLGATWTGILSGDGALRKSGGGTLVLNGANSYTGGSWITGGTLQLGATGSLSPTGAVQVDDGAVFDVNDNTQTIGAFAGAGNVLLGSGELTTDSDLDTTYSGEMSGTGSFIKAGSGILQMTGDSTYTGDTTVRGGQLALNGTLTSDVTVEAGAGLSGNGTMAGLSILGGAAIAPGNSIGTLHVTGNASFASNSTYRVELNSAGNSDLVDIDGTATIDGGLVQVIPIGGTYASLTTYTILTAAGGRTGEFDDVTSSLAFLDPSLEYDANNVYLNMQRNSVNFDEVARTFNQRSVATALNQLPLANPLVAVITGQTAEGARQAYDALSGEVYASTSTALANQSFFVRNAILSRLLQGSYSGPSGQQTAALGAGGPTAVALNATPPMEGRMALGAYEGVEAPRVIPSYGEGLVFWAQGYGSWGQYDGNANAATVTSSLGGFVTGVDAAISPAWRAGLATGYTRTDLSVGARSSSSDVNSYLLAGYAGGTVGDFALRGGAAWTWNAIDATRNVVFPGFFETETASYNGNVGQIFAELAYPLLFADSSIEPFGGLAWVHIGTDSFTEAGGSAALSVASSSDNVGFSTLGLRAANSMPVNGMLVTPRASFAWQYAFGDTTPDLALAFASTSANFGILGVPLARNSALIEAGVDMELRPQTRFGISYVGQLASDLQDNGVQATLDWRF